MSSGLSFAFRALLLLVSLGTLYYFLRKIRKAKVQIHDITFWLLFSLILVVLSIFPSIPGFFSRLLGIQSPANFLFLAIIFLLLIHQFSLTVKLSMLESKLNSLGRKYAIEEAQKEERKEQKKGELL